MSRPSTIKHQQGGGDAARGTTRRGVAMMRIEVAASAGSVICLSLDDYAIRCFLGSSLSLVCMVERRKTPKRAKVCKNVIATGAFAKQDGGKSGFASEGSSEPISMVSRSVYQKRGRCSTNAHVAHRRLNIVSEIRSERMEYENSRHRQLPPKLRNGIISGVSKAIDYPSDHCR